jgi:hypothetical protein
MLDILLMLNRVVVCTNVFGACELGIRKLTYVMTDLTEHGPGLTGFAGTTTSRRARGFAGHPRMGKTKCLKMA